MWGSTLRLEMSEGNMCKKDESYARFSNQCHGGILDVDADTE
jgi:hypothetical protein